MVGFILLCLKFLDAFNIAGALTIKKSHIKLIKLLNLKHFKSYNFFSNWSNLFFNLLISINSKTFFVRIQYRRIERRIKKIKILRISLFKILKFLSATWPDIYLALDSESRKIITKARFILGSLERFMFIDNDSSNLEIP